MEISTYLSMISQQSKSIGSQLEVVASQSSILVDKLSSGSGGDEAKAVEEWKNLVSTLIPSCIATLQSLPPLVEMCVAGVAHKSSKTDANSQGGKLHPEQQKSQKESSSLTAPFNSSEREGFSKPVILYQPSMRSNPYNDQTHEINQRQSAYHQEKSPRKPEALSYQRSGEEFKTEIASRQQLQKPNLDDRRHITENTSAVETGHIGFSHVSLQPSPALQRGNEDLKAAGDKVGRSDVDDLSSREEAGKTLSPQQSGAFTKWIRNDTTYVDDPTMYRIDFLCAEKLCHARKYKYYRKADSAFIRDELIGSHNHPLVSGNSGAAAQSIMASLREVEEMAPPVPDVSRQQLQIVSYPEMSSMSDMHGTGRSGITGEQAYYTTSGGPIYFPAGSMMFSSGSEMSQGLTAVTTDPGSVLTNQHGSMGPPSALKPPLRRRTDSVHRNQNDFWEWRKYGQKNLKDATKYRSYYRCAEKTCEAKKVIDFLRDGRVFREELMGSHNHNLPPKPTRVKLTFNKDKNLFESADPAVNPPGTFFLPDPSMSYMIPVPEGPQAFPQNFRGYVQQLSDSVQYSGLSGSTGSALAMPAVSQKVEDSRQEGPVLGKRKVEGQEKGEVVEVEKKQPVDHVAAPPSPVVEAAAAPG